MQNWDFWLWSFLRVLICVEAFLDLVLIHITESFDFLLIGRAEAAVQLPALFPSVPYGEALPLAEDSLLQKRHSLVPNGFPGNRDVGEDQRMDKHS